jgi:tetratricopeptide (TPR) repeat protein
MSFKEDVLFLLEDSKLASDPAQLKEIIYVSIPQDFNESIGEFTFDPSILLPIEKIAGDEEWNLDSLSWEMIIAAILKVLAYEPNHDNADYFRDLVLAVKPDVVNELNQTAIVKASQKEFKLSEEIFRALLSLEPENNRSLLNLALFYDQRSQNAENLGNSDRQSEYQQLAFSWYLMALNHPNILSETYLYAGYFFFKHQNFEKSQECFESFLGLEPESEQVEEIRKLLGEIERSNLRDTLFKEAYDFIRIGKEEEGLEKIDRFLEENETVWNAWFIKGWGLRRLARYELAAEAFGKAIELGGENTDSLNELAICHLELGKFDEAEKQLTIALRNEPENIKVMSNLGILAMKTGNNDEARSYFNTVLEYAPDDAIAKQYLDHLREN